MGCQKEVTIGDNLVFTVTTHDPDTGVVADADAGGGPDYYVYDETGTAILSGSMAKWGDTTGFYSELIECTSGNDFESGKSYNIYIEATVDGDKGAISYGFRALAKDVDDLNDVSTADVNAQCDTALSEYGANKTAPPTVGEIRTKLEDSESILYDLNAATILVDTTIASEDDLTTTTCRLMAGKSADDAYNGAVAVIHDGTQWVARTVVDYASANKVLTWAPAMDAAPSNGASVYIVPGNTVLPNQIRDAVAAITLEDLEDMPTATATWVKGLSLLFMKLRNKVTETASEQTIYDDDDNAEFEATMSDEDGTFTKGEFGDV